MHSECYRPSGMLIHWQNLHVPRHQQCIGCREMQSCELNKWIKVLPALEGKYISQIIPRTSFNDFPWFYMQLRWSNAPFDFSQFEFYNSCFIKLTLKSKKFKYWGFLEHQWFTEFLWVRENTIQVYVGWWYNLVAEVKRFLKWASYLK
jgi:hypothetical protein